MSGTYKAKGGESWSDVARRTTGVDTDAASIRRANPGYSAPLLSGAVIHIPQWEKSDISNLSDDPLTIKVNGQQIRTVRDFELAVSIDACAKGGFIVPNTPETRDMFEPLSYPIVTVDSYGERLFTGRAATPKPENSENEKAWNVSIWADPAILEDCPPPNDSFPWEWKDQPLKKIATDLAEQHGINVIYDAEERARFKRVDIQQGEAVMGFLQSLAAQRGLVLASDELANLIIHEGTGGKRVSNIEKGKFPCVGMDVDINDAAYYSSVTVKMPSKSRKGRNGKSYEVPNPIIVPGIIRPYHYTAEDVDEGELKAAAYSVAGRMFAEIVTASVSAATWRNDAGGLYRPGQLATIKSEEDRVYRPFEMLVKSLSFKRDSAAETLEMQLVMPGVYSGDIPKEMPWQR